MNKEKLQVEKIKIINLFDSIKKRKKRIKKSKNDFFYFFETYLSHYAINKRAKFQEDIIKLIETDHKYICIAAPRGFSKSTLVSFAYVIWCIIKKKYKFIIIIASTNETSEDISHSIRSELNENMLLKTDFGNLIEKWGSKGDFIANNVRIFSRGKKQATRGFKHISYRPDLIILDDIEKDDEAFNPKIVKNTISIILKSIIPSLSPEGRIVAIGTILQKKCVFDYLLSHSSWHNMIIKSLEINSKGEEVSIWKERFSTKFLQNQREVMGISAFNSEYQNIPENNYKIFDENMINIGESKYTTSIMFIDPSIDGIENGDFKSCVLIKGNHEKIEIKDIIFVKKYDIEFFTKICNLYEKNKEYIIYIGIESNGFQKYFMKELQNFSEKKKISLPLKPIKNYLKKEYRIMRLLSLFETKKIVFNPELIKSDNGKLLIEQLLYFPDKKIHDDGPDALASAVSLLLNIKIEEEQEESNINNIIQLPNYRKKFIL